MLTGSYSSSEQETLAERAATAIKKYVIVFFIFIIFTENQV